MNLVKHKEEYYLLSGSFVLECDIPCLAVCGEDVGLLTTYIEGNNTWFKVIASTNKYDGVPLISLENIDNILNNESYIDKKAEELVRMSMGPNFDKSELLTLSNISFVIKGYKQAIEDSLTEELGKVAKEWSVDIELDLEVNDPTGYLSKYPSIKEVLKVNEKGFVNILKINL